MSEHEDKAHEEIVRKRAVALGYNEQFQDAPEVKAKGKGYMAEELIAKAKAANVPIQEDQSLVELLSQLEINESIPTELYEVVAEVFAFVYRIDQNVHS
ncbi:EscU/YscU/HrcU family type III secretion system export apparatus switch protein [Salsuginibacillus kocurii]|uniref:EscU/YscU/HrcU family type III secretion system export apparatus switch protein n=1 Tax=Salsuginibacillus kocurii TaxID=427078 RepID=UPI000369BD04|nr:EscU/YscU/HrcU family type III secretion system export apparatus switch protein [Salsuginibacillus kocurii]